MTIKEAVNERHSVRQYKNIPIENEKEKELRDFIEAINDENGLDIQFIINDPECFDSFLARYGKFTNVQNYIAMVGNKEYPNLDEAIGYFGEEIVLKA